MKVFGKLFILFLRIRNRILTILLRNLFYKCGENVRFNPFDYFSFNSIELGSDIYIGPGAYISSSHSRISIGNKVMFGPNVLLLGGDHNYKELGKFMFDSKLKNQFTDGPIVIEDDVWIGANCVVLKNVTVGTGSIIAAGSIVNKNVDPYSIYGGTPAKKLKDRFSERDLQKHLELLRKS